MTPEALEEEVKEAGPGQVAVGGVFRVRVGTSRVVPAGAVGVVPGACGGTCVFWRFMWP